MIEYASFLAQWEDRMNKTNKQALQSVESAKTQADRAENEADRAERAREDVTAAKTEVAAMREAVVADKAAVEAAQKDVAGRQAEISTAHEDIKLKTTAVLQAAEQVSNDKQAVDRAVAAFDETAANAVETIDDKAAAARQDVDDAASNATGTINSAAAAAETRINKAASDSAESIARQAQAVESAVSAAKTDITGMVSNAQAAESAAAQSAAQAAQSAQEAQAAADSVGDVSVLKTAMTGTGGVTLEYTADRPLKSLTISGVDVGNVNVWLCGKNIFDKSRAKNGYYVDANGNEVAGANWCVATIPLPPNRSVAITASYQGGAPRYCFFDSGGTLLLATQSKTLTTPDGTAYAKISISKNELDTFLVEFSSAQTEYTPYTGVEVVVDPQDIDTSKMRCYRGTTNIMAYTTDWQQLTVTAEAIQDLNLVIQEIKQAIIAGGAI